MQLEWIQHSNNVNWKKLSALYKIAPLGDKSPENLKLVFKNSLYKIFVYEKNKLVGVGRALADGVDCSYICDIAVHPDFQGMGLGKSIVSKLVSLSKGHKKILLYSVPGKEKFYAKFGFKKMKTAMAIFENQSQAIKWQLIGDEI